MVVGALGNVPSELVEASRAAYAVTVLTGAGMSAESGLETFRDPQVGLWERFRPEDLASPEAWAADPALVWAWYLWRFERAASAEPNAGHHAIARWSNRAGVEVRVVTQNVDDLHERAGAPSVVHVHGRVGAFRCADCASPYGERVEVPSEPAERIDPPVCRDCGGLIRPGVVWFGEAMPAGAWESAELAVSAADLVLVVGTSALVHPAAGLPALARACGATVAEINPVPTPISDQVHLVWRERAARALPALVAQLAPSDPGAR